MRGALQFQNDFSEKCFSAGCAPIMCSERGGGISIAGKSRKGGGMEKEKVHVHLMYITNKAGFQESYK